MKILIGTEKGTPTVLRHGLTPNTLFVGTAGGRILIYDV